VGSDAPSIARLTQPRRLFSFSGILQTSER